MVSLFILCNNLIWYCYMSSSGCRCHCHFTHHGIKTVMLVIGTFSAFSAYDAVFEW